MGIFKTNLRVKCESDEKEGHLLCTARDEKDNIKGKLLLKASKDGMKIVGEDGLPEVTDLLLTHAEKRSRILKKDDF